MTIPPPSQEGKKSAEARLRRKQLKARLKRNGKLSEQTPLMLNAEYEEGVRHRRQPKALDAFVQDYLDHRSIALDEDERKSSLESSHESFSSEPISESDVFRESYSGNDSSMVVLDGSDSSLSDSTFI